MAALAFSAPAWVYATQTMDYTVAMALTLGAYACLLDRRYLAGGVLLALASGCRLSNAAPIVPALAMLVARRDGWRGVASFGSSFLAATALVYAPVALSFRSEESVRGFWWHASRVHATAAALPGVVRRDAVFLFGKLGSLALVAGLVAGAATRIVGRLGEHSRPRPAHARASGGRSGKTPRADDADAAPAVVFEVVSVGVIGVLYLMVPYEVDYLVPILPFLVLLTGCVLSRRFLIAAALLMASESLAMPLFDAHRVAPGRILLEIGRRRADLAETRAPATRRPGAPSVFVVGRVAALRLLVLAPWLEHTDAIWPPVQDRTVALWTHDRTTGYAALLTAEAAETFESRGYRIIDLWTPAPTRTPAVELPSNAP